MLTVVIDVELLIPVLCEDSAAQIAADLRTRAFADYTQSASGIVSVFQFLLHNSIIVRRAKRSNY